MKNSILKYLFLFLFAFTYVDLFAQVVITPSDVDTFAKVTAFVKKWGVFILAIWEIVVRYIPTAQSLSFVTLIMRIIEFLVPDAKASGQGFLPFGSHSSMERQKLNTSIHKGDKLKTKNGQIVVVQRFINPQSVMSMENKTVPLTDVIEVVKNTYTLIDVVKNIFTFFKVLFSKKQTVA